MKEEMQDFEQMLENEDTKTAIKKYYGKYWKRIAGSAVGIAVIAGLYLAHVPVWQRLSIVGVLVAGTWIYGRFKDNG
jgi:hypothetical protein